MKLVIDKDLTYYPNDIVYKSMQSMLIYLLQRPDGALQSQLVRKFKITVTWIERLEKTGAIRVTSKWIGKDPKKVNRPWIYTVKVWNKRKALNIIQKDVAIHKMISKESEVADRISRLLDSKEREAGEIDEDA